MDFVSLVLNSTHLLLALPMVFHTKVPKIVKTFVSMANLPERIQRSLMNIVQVQLLAMEKLSVIMMREIMDFVSLVLNSTHLLLALPMVFHTKVPKIVKTFVSMANLPELSLNLRKALSLQLRRMFVPLPQLWKEVLSPHRIQPSSPPRSRRVPSKLEGSLFMLGVNRLGLSIII